MDTFVATQLHMLMYIERMSINLFSSFYAFAFTRKYNFKRVIKCLLLLVPTPNYLLREENVTMTFMVAVA